MCTQTLNREGFEILAHYLSFSSAMTEKEQNIFKTRETKIEKFCPSVVVHKCVPGDGDR